MRVVWAVVLVLVVAACGGSGAAPRSAASPSSQTRSKAHPATRTRTRARALARARAPRPPQAHGPSPPFPDVGRLPQTSTLPSVRTARFRYEMTALWRGVVSGGVGPAMPAFFPEDAYAQVKAIPDVTADWRERLVGGFAADIAAAHALLGANASRARLVRVIVPPGYAHWVQPGVCYNRTGYWETPNSRVVYRIGGSVRSFGIASMISWRGVWFVVHLGAVVRSGAGGVLDAPSTGDGYAAPSSTC
jgi:hypothetical protein